VTVKRDSSEVTAGWSQGMSGTVFHPEHVIHVEHVWNTAITINVQGTQGREDGVESAIRRCSDFFGEVDRTFSTYSPQTEVSFYRNGLGWSAGHTREFDEVIAACTEIRALTRGAFDPWAVPGGYDPSGFVKGWAAGRASSLLRDAGFPDHLVNAGGDICTSGDERPASGGGWAVGIQDPRSPADVIAVVTLHDMSMATSGRYQRGDHVVDPVTGRPATAVDSATVVGPDAGTADALASAALVDGRDSLAWFTALGAEWSLHLVIGDAGYSFGPAFGQGPDAVSPPKRSQ
jgi:FAD:protein FMN transferase